MAEGLQRRKVSTNNQPYDLLDKRIRKEHILRKR